MATLTVETYVKAIYQICTEAHSRSAATGSVAKRLGVSPGTVTSMLRTLAESGLANYQAYEGVQLTEAGRRLALRVLRRHRLIELFLVQTLGLTWDEVHEEAEHLEHAVSDRLIDRIDSFLEYPNRDPHGDPIPRPDGSFPDDETTEPLVRCEAATEFVLDRVIEQSPEFLRYLSDAGLSIGSSGTVVENHPSARALVVKTSDGQVTLGHDLAEKILIRRSRD
ncbi:metal-dependent transcriptional regulator [bacterium]|nr:metal-dependent transcriptional regulator [bacterium]